MLKNNPFIWKGRFYQLALYAVIRKLYNRFVSFSILFLIDSDTANIESLMEDIKLDDVEDEALQNKIIELLNSPLKGKNEITCLY